MGFISSIFRQFVHPPPIPPTVNLRGQSILITGANSGIGLEAARQCVGLEAEKVILAVRSMSKGESAKSDIESSQPNANTKIEIWILDMESFDSVMTFRQRVNALPRLDVAILNAAVFKFEWATSPETGYETSLQVNHLSTALLSLSVVPVLQKTTRDLGRPSRLTFSSSEVHMFTPFRERKAEHVLQRLNEEKYFEDSMDRYSVTKLLNVFWVRELAARIAATDLVVNFFNPGSVNTGLHRDGNKIIQAYDRFIGRTVEEGGRLVLDAAIVKGSESHGKYMSEGNITEVSPFVRSPEGAKMQKQLWIETESVLKRHLPPTTIETLLAELHVRAGI